MNRDHHDGRRHHEGRRQQNNRNKTPNVNTRQNQANRFNKQRQEEAAAGNHSEQTGGSVERAPPEDHCDDVNSIQLDALSLQVDELCQNVHSSLHRAINSTHNMPLSEHVLYSSYQSYDNIMVEQRETLDDMMTRLADYSNIHPMGHAYGLNADMSGQQQHSRTDFKQIDNLIDKYDNIHEFNEQMFDRIGSNLDDAAGLTSQNAKLVQATLEAANKNKMITNQSYLGATSKQAQNQAQHHLNRNLSSSSSASSSSSLSKQPTEFNAPQQSATSANKTQMQHHQQHLQFNNQQQQQRYKYQKPQTQPVNKVVFNPVNSVVQSSQQQQQQPRNQFGGYLGKQQFGSTPSNQRFVVLENKNLPRPQNSFKDKIDNSYRPFEPLIKVKPNAYIPLRTNVERDEHGNEFYSHPYEQEISNFVIKPEILLPSQPIEPPDLSSTPIILVETIEQLEEMCRHIESQKEFAVDVEHHSYRSFQGITCLLQISTRTQDFVIDAIKLRSELYRLNQSFTNPDITKVFHGADCDILWLQRDFGVYVVNLFDTSRAAKLMKFAHLSLAFLMKHYCNVEPDKSYQLADWRERPLPLPMLQYARADTHFLLYIYDRLKNDLYTRGGHNKTVGQDLLRSVYERGRDICLKRYEKPPFSDTSHLSVLRKSRSTFNAKQMFAFRELYSWRDAISRELDESVGYVLPNNLMIRFAEYLPREPQGITALCNPIPPTVKKYLSDIHAIILKAIDVPLDETTKVIAGSHLNVDPTLRSIDLDTISHKQDIAHSAGMQESTVPNLLDRMHKLNCSNDDNRNGHSKNSSKDSFPSNARNNMRRNVNQTPTRLYNFLDHGAWNKNSYSEQSSVNHVHESIQKQFVSPYHRYEARNN